MRKRKEQLSTTYNLSLEQVEWAYALSVTLADFDSLLIERQLSVLGTLCGPPNGEGLDGFSTLFNLWEETSTLSPEVTNWLLQGLSQPEAIQTFFACLEQFQEEDVEQAKLNAQADGDAHSILSDESESCMDVESIIGSADSWRPDTVTNGQLLLRIQHPLHNSYHYRTLDGSIDKTLYDASMETDLLTNWMKQHEHNEHPLAMLCFNWKTAESAGHRKTIVGEVSTASLGLENTSDMFNHVVRHEGSMECYGGHRNTIQKGGINLKRQTIQSASQHLEHWCMELYILRGDHLPMYWNLENTVAQKLNGLGHRGGFVSLESNVYVQIVDEHNQYLLGTPSEHEPIFTSRLNDHSTGSNNTSHINTWLSDPPIDFSNHVVHNTANSEPIFNNTPPIEQTHSCTTEHKGFGYKLHGLFFAELQSKVWQNDSGQRVDLVFQNQIESTVTGSIYWSGHHLYLLDGEQLRWKNNDIDIKIEWGLTQAKQISTQKEYLPTSNNEVETIRIQHIQITHQYEHPI